jgi:hypothetical protein
MQDTQESGLSLLTQARQSTNTHRILQDISPHRDERGVYTVGMGVKALQNTKDRLILILT